MNVRIRPLEEQDAYTSVEWRNDPEIWGFTKFSANREITISDELAWIRGVMADESSRRFAILADESYIGNIYLTDIKDGTGEYHIFIGDKDYWGKGIARKASQLIIDYGRNVLHLSSIELGAKEANRGAYHLYETLGFKKIGTDSEGFTRMALDLRKSK